MRVSRSALRRLRPVKQFGISRGLKPKRMDLERLESRHLLAGLVGDPLFDSPIDSGDDNDPVDNLPTYSALEAARDARVSFHGSDGHGKDGPLARLGDDLTLLFHQHQLHEQGDLSDRPFRPTDQSLQVLGDDVYVQIVSAGAGQLIAPALTDLGMNVTATDGRVAVGTIPIDSLDEVVGVSGFAFARPAYRKITRDGVIDSERPILDDHFNLAMPIGDLAESQGDVALDANLARVKHEIDGAGINLGVISDSFNVSAPLLPAAAGLTGAAADIALGDLPADGVNVVAELAPLLQPGTDEGRAMLQLAHDIAPGANLSFSTSGETPIEAANNTRRLADAGANIIVDDIGFPDEPFFQNGHWDRAINDVVNTGVSYFAAAGNESTNSYESAFVDSGVPGLIAGGTLHDFDPGPLVDTTQQITVPLGSALTLSFQWDQPWESLGNLGSSSDLDIFLLGADGRTLIDSSVANNVNGDAIEIIFFTNTGVVDVDGFAGADEQFNLVIQHTAGPQAGLMKSLVFGGSIDEYETESSTAWGHVTAEGAIAVAASSYFFTPRYGIPSPVVNEFSSKGGIPTLFDESGNRLPEPIVQPRPNVTGPDNVNTTFFPDPTDPLSDSPVDQDNPQMIDPMGMVTVIPNPIYGAVDFPNFPGTSAAAPHIAAVAALMLEAAGGPNSLTPSQIRSILESSTTDIKDRSTPDVTQPSQFTFSLPAVPIPDGEGFDFFSGHGFVSAFEAVEKSLLFEEGSGTISGTKWHDLNGNGVRDTGEPGLSGWTIFVDIDQDGQLGPVDRSTTTSSSGAYSFDSLPTGSLTIAEVPQDGWVQTFPDGSGTHQVFLSDGQTRSGLDFGNRREAGSVSGVVFDDLNGNGVQDDGESGIAGLIVHIDADNNGLVGFDEPSAETGEGGRYEIVGVNPGDVTVRLAVAAGIVPSNGGTLTVSVSQGVETTGANFGVRRVSDYGDAPSPYPTLSASNGPSHGFIPGFRLGSTFDGEADGRPHPTAQGDDFSGTTDEDGIVFVSGLQPGQRADLLVLASNLSVSPGYLHGWIDFNGDGDWADPGEQIVKNRHLADGTNLVSFDVPADAQAFLTFARFRWGFELELPFSGPSLGGEVEDYAVSIPMDADVGFMALDDMVAVEEDSSDNSLDVLANDFSRVEDPLSIVDVSTPNRGGIVSIVDGQTLNYTPSADFFGTESFTYSITDGRGLTSTATVSVDVSNVNDVPTANDDQITVFQSSVNNVLDVLANDTIEPDLNETLQIVSVSAPSEGGLVTVGSNGSNLLYSPASGFLGSETLTYTVSDGNGGTDAATVTIEVLERPDVVGFRLETTDLAGTPITTINEGGSFLLQGYVEDLRPEPEGVFSAYLDVTYAQSDLISPAGPVEIQAPYNNNQSGDSGQPGLLDEVGGTDGFDTLGGGEFQLFSIEFQASAVGTVDFASNAADNMPLHQVSFFGETTPVLSDDIVFGTTEIEIVDSGASDDSFTVQEDSVGVLLDVLDNDEFPGGNLTIGSVSLPSNDGTATVFAESMIEYSPAPDFFGTETFTYTVTDGQGHSGLATVTVTVENVNDAPNAGDDAFDVAEGNADVTLPVLDNDTFLPDPFEEIVVTAVSDPSEGGTVAIAADGKSVDYTPTAGFGGEETFTYTISDESGLTDQATVTVNVEATDKLVRFRLATVDDAGNAITQVNVGSGFDLQVYVQDLRDDPLGVASAYLDVTYDATLATVDGEIDVNDDAFPFVQTGSTDMPGLIDEAGGFAGLSPTDPGEALLFEASLMADDAGQLTFASNLADSPLSEVLLVQGTEQLTAEQIDFGSVLINVVSGNTFTNALNPLDVNGDGNTTPLDALLIINDMDLFGARELPRPSNAITHTVRADAAQPPSSMIDVNADGFVSPLDALLVINELTRLAAAGSQGFAAKAAADSPQGDDPSAVAGILANSGLDSPEPGILDGAGAGGTANTADGSRIGTSVNDDEGRLDSAIDVRAETITTNSIGDSAYGKQSTVDRDADDLEDALADIAEEVSENWNKNTTVRLI